MSEKEKNIVPSTAEAEMSEEEKQKLLEQFDKESKTRKFGSPVLKKAYRIFAIIVTLYHLVFASGLYMPETLKHRSIHVGMILILAFMLYPATKKASRKVIAWYDYVFIALSAAVPIYMCVDYVNIINRAGKPDMMDTLNPGRSGGNETCLRHGSPDHLHYLYDLQLNGDKAGTHPDRCPGHFPPQRIHMAEVNEPLLLEHGRYLRIVSQCRVHLHLPLHRLR